MDSIWLQNMQMPNNGWVLKKLSTKDFNILKNIDFVFLSDKGVIGYELSFKFTKE